MSDNATAAQLSLLSHQAEKTRVDKWLWSVRLFKTRSLSADACNGGKVKINSTNAKPAKEIHIGTVIEVHLGTLVKTVKVCAIPKSRIPAKLVEECYNDLTPPEEYARVQMLNTKFETRPRGLGRPTKKDRRQIECLKWYFGEDMLEDDNEEQFPDFED
ncbi:MAG: RNA-binding S4 domain-containing protein [Bacteroidales bacterium]|nr:RNA-binding S4 domain-containing protein [Bacteroidales bacterium]